MAWVCDPTEFVRIHEYMGMYVDTAKTYMNLSAGALGLTIVFREKIVGAQPGQGIHRLMLACWLLFLLAIAASALYQYLGVKDVAKASCLPYAKAGLSEFLSLQPAVVYGMMLALFFGGGVALVAAVWKQLPRDPNASDSVDR